MPACSCTTVLLEVQDTLREPPAAVVSMKKAVPFALLTTFVLVRRGVSDSQAVLRCRCIALLPRRHACMHATVLRPPACPPAHTQYLGVTVTGYAALGDDVTGSILLSFAAAPGWAVILANLFVLIHMISACERAGSRVAIAGMPA